MKKLIQIILLILLGFSGKNAYSSHMAGAEITYRCIDSLKFEVTIKWYRDCQGISLTGAGAGALTIRCGSTTINDTLSLISIKDITPLCYSLPSKCNPTNTTGTGDGLEEHIYMDTIDFNTTPLSALASCSSNIILSASINYRNSSISTGPGGALYVQSELNLNLAPTNSSPILTTPNQLYLCCNQPLRSNIGAVDTTDSDSLSYAFVHPKRSYGQNVSFSGSFAYNNPITVYYPGSQSFPYSAPNANPPIGIYLSPTTGDLTFTPTDCQQVAVMAIEVTEWRKNSAGTAQIVGRTTRDMQMTTINCQGFNWPPTLDGTSSHSVCEGSKLCFNITANDQTYTLPPPRSSPAPDTTQLTWNKGIPDASFAILDSSARIKIGRFCWTPSQGDARSLPYTFTATARDDNCPLNAISTKVFTITVLDAKESTSQIVPLTCGQFEITTNEDTTGFTGTPVYKNELYDQNYNLILSKNLVLFASTDSALASRSIKKDTITIFNSGIYYLKQLVEGSSASSCAQYNWDTLDLSSYFGVELNYSSDKICVNDTLKLTSTLVNTDATHTYAWYVNDTLRGSDTLSTFNMHFPTANRDTIYMLAVTDTAGCVVKDFVHVQSGDSSNFTLGIDSLYCRNTVELAPSVAQAYYAWNTGDSATSLFVDSSGIYSLVGTNAFNCVYYDTVQIAVSKELPSLAQSYDYLACDTFTYIVADSTFDSYLWNTGDTGFAILLDSTSVYTLTVNDTNGCVFSDSINFMFHNTVNIILSNETKQCDSLVLSFAPSTFPTILWEDSTSSYSRLITDTSRLIWIQAVDSNGCRSSDSLNFSYYTKPSLGLVDTSFCTDSIFIQSNSFSKYQWSSGDTTDQIWFTLSDNYSLTVTDSFNCNWTDSIQVGVGEPNLLGNVISCGAYSPILAPYLDSIAWADGSTSLSRVFLTDTVIGAVLYSKEGCAYTDTLSLTVNQLNPFNLNDTFTCEDTLFLNTSGYDAILWNTGSTSFEIGTDTSGIFYYTATDTNGCVYSDTVNAQLFITNPVSLGSDTTVCDQIRLNTSPSLASVTWDNGSTNTYRDFTSTITASVVAQDSNGCVSYDTVSVVVNYSPTISLSPIASTCDTSYTFTVSTTDSLLWSTGASDTSITVNTSGNYTVIQRTAEGCSDTGTVSMSFLATDTLNLGPDTTICRTYSISPSTSIYSSFLWNDGSTIGTKNIDTAGTYWLTATNSAGCSSSDTITIYIHTISPVTLNNDTTCGDSLIVSAPTGYANYLWSTGDTTLSTAVTSTGSVWLSVLDTNGCASSDTANFVVYKAIQADLGPDLSRCGGSQLIRSNISGANYLWNTGQTTAIIFASTSGQYSVDITNSNGCVTSDTINIDIYSQPSSGLPDTLEVCSDTGVVLVCTPFAQTIWNTGDTTSSISVNISGRYSVAVTDSFGCSNTDYIDLTINSLPLVTAGNDTVHCGDTIVLTATGATSYLWNTTETTNSISTSVSGSYIVSGTDVNGCMNTDSITVELVDFPSPDLGSDSTYCSNYVTLNPGNFSNYSWSTGASTNNIFATSSGMYSVSVTDTNGCVASDSILLEINAIPTVNLGNDTAFCENTLTLDAGSYPTTSWNTGSSSQTININTTGTYSVSVTDTNSCSAIDSISIVVFNNPTLNLGNDTAFCGDSLLLALAPGNNYSWSNGDTLSFTTIYSSGDYWISITDSNGCSASDTVNITFNNNTNVPTLTRVGDSIESNLTGTHYWFLDDLATTDANANVIGINGRMGSFTAVHQDTNGCISDTSNSILRTLGIAKLSSSALKVYPNPSNGKVTIDLEGLGALQSIKLYDAQGKLVENTQAINGSLIELIWTARSGVLWIVVDTKSATYREQIITLK
jgi:hypothetical protein